MSQAEKNALAELLEAIHNRCLDVGKQTETYTEHDDRYFREKFGKLLDTFKQSLSEKDGG